MYNVEFHRGTYGTGRSPLQREASADLTVDAVLASAKLRAMDLGADNIVIINDVGAVVGVFSTFGSDMD
jgi:carbamate kinase